MSKLSIIQINLNKQFRYNINKLNNFVMNLKERGITLGDLILIIIFIFSTVFIINKVKESDDQAHFQIDPIEILTANKS